MVALRGDYGGGGRVGIGVASAGKSVLTGSDIYVFRYDPPALFGETQPTGVKPLVLPAGDYILVGFGLPTLAFGNWPDRSGKRVLPSPRPVEFSLAPGEAVNLGVLEVTRGVIPGGSLEFLGDGAPTSYGAAKPDNEGRVAIAYDYPAFANVIVDRPFACAGCPTEQAKWLP